MTLKLWIEFGNPSWREKWDIQTRTNILLTFDVMQRRIEQELHKEFTDDAAALSAIYNAIVRRVDRL